MKSWLITSLIAKIARSFSFSTASHTESTPNIPSGHGLRTKAKLPNDGRWHMKHHRSRG